MTRRGVGAHLLRVESEATVFAPLIAALAALGLRCGWLDLVSDPEAPADLEAAARLGVMRAVAAGAGRTLAVKPVKGGLVLRDLLREHFSGCDVVLVRGAVEAATLSPSGDDAWTVTPLAGEPREHTSAQLARRLRRPGGP